MKTVVAHKKHELVGFARRAAKKTDQQIDIMKAMMESRSGELVIGDAIDEEFSPWSKDV